MSEQNIARLKLLAEEVCVRENCRLYDLEIVGQGKGRILRVYIDRLASGEQSSAVSLDDCANVSHGLSLQLDVEDLIPGGGYHLEVSSPGLDRRLKEPWHFRTVVGQKVRVWLERPLGEIISDENSTPAHFRKSQRLEGTVQSADENTVDLGLGETSFRIPFSEIEKAKAVVEFVSNTPPGMKNKKTKRNSSKKKR